MSEWKENENPDGWNEQNAGTLEEQAEAVLAALDEFGENEEHHQEEMEEMMEKIQVWGKKFQPMPMSPMKQRLSDAINITQFNIATEYLGLFNSMEEVDRDACEAMHSFMKIIDDNIQSQFLILAPDKLQLVQDEMEKAMFTILGTYPDILDEEDGEDDENEG